jgi:hypothetical protein
MQATIEALALEIGISMSSIHGWRRAGRVAYRHRQVLIDAAQERHIFVQPADFDAFKKLRPGRRKSGHSGFPAKGIDGDCEARMQDRIGLSSEAA